jgi:hypothetical protein
VFKPVVKVEVKNGPMPIPAFQIQISNDSTFSIYNVSTSAITNGIIGRSVFKREIIDVAPEEIEEIEPGAQPASFSANFLRTPKSPRDRMDVFVTTSFRASFTWWSTSRRKHFAARRLEDGSVLWFEDPSLDMTLPDYPKSKVLERIREQESKASAIPFSNK